MANECLVTRLKSVVSNDNLDKLGILRLKVSHVDSITSDKQQQLVFRGSKAFHIHIDGNGAFCDNYANISTASDKDIDIPANTTKALYFTNPNINETYYVEISEKYTMLRYGPDWSGGKHVVNIDIDKLAYSSDLSILTCNSFNETAYGDITTINKLESLTSIIFSYNYIGGDISKITRTNLQDFNLQENTKVTGDFYNILHNNPNLVSFVVSTTQGITGDISNINGHTSLTQVGFSNTHGRVTGDISVFRNLPNIKILSAYNASGLYGDVENYGYLRLTVTNNDYNIDVYNTNITGTVESYATRRITTETAAGGSMDGITCTFRGNNKVTADGTAFSGTKTITFANGSYTIA